MYITISTMGSAESGHLISVDGCLLPSVVWINGPCHWSHFGGNQSFDGSLQSHGLVSLKCPL